MFLVQVFKGCKVPPYIIIIVINSVVTREIKSLIFTYTHPSVFSLTLTIWNKEKNSITRPTYIIMKWKIKKKKRRTPPKKLICYKGWKVPGLIILVGISVETYSLVIENHKSLCVGGGSTSLEEVTVTIFDLLARSGIRSNRDKDAQNR